MLKDAYRVVLIRLLDGESEEALLILLDCLRFAGDMAKSALIGDVPLGGKSLVPGWLESFGQLGGWKYFTSEQVERWLEAALTVDAELEPGGPRELVELIINVHAVPAFLAEAQHKFDQDRAEMDPSSPRGKADLLEQLFHDHTILLDMQEQCTEALAKEPLRGPTRVRTHVNNRYSDGSNFLTGSIYKLWLHRPIISPA